MKSNARRAFTLLEVLLASALAAVLLGAVLSISAAMSRDRRMMEKNQNAGDNPGLFMLLRKDLASAAAMSSSGGDLILIGHGGIGGQALESDARLACVIYHITRDSARTLVRRQFYLDDPIRPLPWSDAAAGGVRRFEVLPTSSDASAVNLSDDIEVRLRQALGQQLDSQRLPARRPGSRVRVMLETMQGIQEQEMLLK